MLDVLMADATNPRSLAFQINHLADLYQKLPRHMPDDLRTIRDVSELLQSFDLRSLEYPLPGAASREHPPGELLRLQELMKTVEGLLPSWSDNLSNMYFSHARTLSISIG